MKTIKSLKEITTLEVGDKVVFGDLKYEVSYEDGYYLQTPLYRNDKIFTNLNISKKDFVKNLGINTLPIDWDFPEVCSLEALTAIVSALFKEYEKQNELPKTWEEFCKRNPVKKGECHVTNISMIHILPEGISRDVNFDKNLCTSEQDAKAFIALNQLCQLRKAYVKDWEPNWNTPEIKYVIKVIGGNCYQIIEKDFEISPLSFPTYKLAQQFLTNFKDLIEIAKPLL